MTARDDAPVGILLRVLLLAAMALSGWQVLQRSQALELALPQNGVGGLEQSVERDSSYPRARFLLGMVRRDLPGSEDLEAAVSHFARAVGLNPYSWRYRLEQSRTLELAGSLREAEEALEEAVRLNPRSGAYRWRLANFQLRHGPQEKAVQQIGEAIVLDPSLQPAALSILFKSGLDFDQIEGIWPTDTLARLRLLRGLCSSLEPEAALASARRLWNDLLATEPPLPMIEGRFYPGYLLDVGQFEAAREAWSELASRNGLVDSDFEAGREAVWNGEFDFPLQGRPLGWVLGRSDDFRAKQVQEGGVDGGPALELEFLGNENLNFAGLSQTLLVGAGTEYRLTANLRTEEISTDEGIFLEVFDKASGRVLLATDPVLGTRRWTEQSGVLQAPDAGGALVVRLRRRPSRMLDSKIRGKIWLDEVSLEPASRSVKAP